MRPDSLEIVELVMAYEDALNELPPGEERDRLIGELNDAHMVTSIYQMKGIGPTLNGRNGEGDPYYTDGEVWVAQLVSGGKETAKPAEMLPAPLLIQMKDAAFSWGSRTIGH